MKTHVRPLFKQFVLAEVRVRPRLQHGGLLPALRRHRLGLSACEASLHTLIDPAMSIVLPRTRWRHRDLRARSPRERDRESHELDREGQESEREAREKTAKARRYEAARTTQRA